jgi:hypothetical protein
MCLSRLNVFGLLPEVRLAAMAVGCVVPKAASLAGSLGILKL